MTRRGTMTLLLGAGLWLASGVAGSDAIRVLGFGFVLLPLLAWTWIAWKAPRFAVKRTLSSKITSIGNTVDVTLELRGAATRRTAPYLLIEDAPARMGTSARLLLEGVAGDEGRRATYPLTPSARGGYKIGPAKVEIFDPFLLARSVQKSSETDTLIVTPAVELLRGMPSAGTQRIHGTSTSRRARGTSEEFATIRPYQHGDDLRRIHWPSVAHSGTLMLRQDEARRSSGTALFLETREATLGRSGEEGFERAVSAAASLALHLAQSSSVHVMTSARASVKLNKPDLLVALASVVHTPAPVLGVDRLRSVRAETVIAVMAPASAEELQALIRAGANASSRIVALIIPSPDTVAGARAGERLATSVHTLRAAGWFVLELDPSTTLTQRWNNSIRPHATSA